jgi:SAM-dependent methyltransferase
LNRLTLGQSTQLYRLLGDPSRLRLLALLAHHELSVAELTEITGLAQSRVSTHLARLKRAGLVRDQRQGAAAMYTTAEGSRVEGVWRLLRERLEDPILSLDRERAEQVILARRSGQTWAESVAGRMELHYSPGRTWEATARALIGLLDLGDTLDIASGDGVLAELISEHARSVTCLDISATVVSAARKRLRDRANVAYCRGDMHRLPFADGRFDHVFAMHALPYARQPEKILAEAARVLRPSGRLIVATLSAHTHRAASEVYDHVNQGCSPATLAGWLRDAGLSVESCKITSREPRPPYFEVVTALAQRR